MKNNRGKVKTHCDNSRSQTLPGNAYFTVKSLVLLLLFSVTLLHARGFTTEASLNKTKAYVKEPVILTFHITQTDYSKVMFFDFTLAESAHYEFYRLDAKEEDSYQNAQIIYTYLLYPLKEGNININFELTQKVTTKENVAYSFSGDRDNVKGITTTDQKIVVAPLTIDIKPLPDGTQLVGDFTLSHTLKKTTANAYEPIPFSVTLRGSGYPPLLEHLLVPNNAFTLFTETPQLQSIRSENGTFNTILYPMAVSAQQSFTLAETTLQAFNPKTEKSYRLTIPAYSFTITNTVPEKLLDKVDSPAPAKATDWSWLTDLFSYLIVFLSGFFTAKTWQWHKKEKQTVDPFAARVAETSDPKVLLKLLIAEDSKKYANAIEKLEGHIYAKKSINLASLKKQIQSTNMQ